MAGEDVMVDSTSFVFILIGIFLHPFDSWEIVVISSENYVSFNPSYFLIVM